MSTISTHLNWGASYLVNDVYLRFIKPDASPRAQVMASRLATVVLMVLVADRDGDSSSSVEQGWKILIGLGAGTGLVFILRWYWWRVNAWSEISAMVASFVTSLALHPRCGHSDERHRHARLRLRDADHGRPSPPSVWLAVTFADRPRVRRDAGPVLPPGPAWRARVAPGRPSGWASGTTGFPAGPCPG